MNNAEGFKVSTLNGVKVYNLTAGKALPSFLSDRQKRNLNKKEQFQHRVQLIQDFEFPTASSSIKMSRNGEYVVAAGCYKPMIRIFELGEMGMKCERFVDSDVVKLEVLSDDYRKLILMQSDRTLEVHAAYGRHFRTRIPKFGRDLMYQRHSSEVFVAASGSDVYRLNLELGQYLAPLEATTSTSFNCLDQSPLLHLVGCGGDDGVVELYDTRTKKSVFQLDGRSNHSGLNADDDVDEVTALRFDSDGLTMTMGTSAGKVNMYDLRRRAPLVTRQHPYEEPIKAIRYHHGKEGRKLVTADAKTIRIWSVHDHRDDDNGHNGRNRSGGSSGRRKNHGDVTSTMFTTIELPAALEDVCMCPRIRGERTNDSGLIMVAGEQSKIMTFYVPELGPAPKWCRYLENITEELEHQGSGNSSSSSSMYDDYKFVTREELKDLNLEHLVGTPLLRGYMHGYFMDARLHSRSKAVAAPDEYETYRKKQIRDKMEEKRSKFITVRRRLPRVNPHMALKLIAEKSGGLHKDNMKELEETLKDKVDGGEGNGGSGNGGDVLIDDRFGSLFNDDDFAIDETSEQFRLSNPSGITTQERSLRKRVGLKEMSTGIDDRTAKEAMIAASRRLSNSRRSTTSQQNGEEDNALARYQGFELVEDNELPEEDEGGESDVRSGRSNRGRRDDEVEGSGGDSDEGAFDALLGVREFASSESGHRTKKKRGAADSIEGAEAGRRTKKKARSGTGNALKFFEMREGAGDADLVPSTSGRRETLRRAKSAKQKSRLTLAERAKGQNGMVEEAKRNRTAQKKHAFSFTPSDVLEQRERKKAEKERRKERRREKRGMKELLPKSKQNNYWKGKKV